MGGPAPAVPHRNLRGPWIFGARGGAVDTVGRIPGCYWPLLANGMRRSSPDPHQRYSLTDTSRGTLPVSFGVRDVAPPLSSPIAELLFFGAPGFLSG